MDPNRKGLPSEEPKRKPLSFRTYAFEPREWEKRQIHRYSVRRPRWWRLWLTLRELGAKVGIR